MMICNIYSIEPAYKIAKDVIRAHLPKAKIKESIQEGNKILELSVKKGLFSSPSKLQISYRERIQPQVKLDEATNCALSANLKGLHGYVNNMLANNEQSKKRFLIKIKKFVCEFAVILVAGEIDNIKEIVREIAQKTDGVLFVDPGSVLSQSPFGQHFLNHEMKLILSQMGESEVDDFGPEVEAEFAEMEKKYEDYINQIPIGQRTRKLNNEKYLTEQGIKVNRFLPAIESAEQIKIREPKEIAQRVAVMCVINGYASDIYPNEKAIEVLKRMHLWEATTLKEKDLLENPTDEKKTKETWKCEGIWTLLWALNIHNDLGDAGQLCDLGNISKDDYPLHDLTGFVNKISTSRSKEEIIDQADLYYRMDWACVDMRLKGLQMAKINQGVVYERHYALNWLINYMGQEWDNVSCDT